jgi:hypothetical protein
MKRVGAIVGAVLLAAVMAPAAAQEEVEDPRFPTDWHVVADGAAGTFGGGGEAAQAGHELGADLLEARIRMPDAEHVEFQIQTTNLPASGGAPEVIRYTWDMAVDTGEGAKVAQLDGKFTNYSRGVCDPTAGCDPTALGADGGPTDPGLQPFFWRGDLEQLDLGATTFNAMRNYATVPAIFDTDEDTITVSVPVEAISLIEGVEWGDCSQILPGAGLNGGVVESSFAAWLTSGAFPHDTLLDVWPGDPVFTAPPALDAEVDCAGNPIDPA